jgi:hopanoid-associated phosphorylase
MVTGLPQEARIAAGPGMSVICSSSDPAQLRAKLAAFNPASIRGIVSFGVAGGLDPTLRSGDIVVASEVVTAATRWSAALTLSADLMTSLQSGRQLNVTHGVLYGAEEVVLHQRDKAALRMRSGAVAVDMESHIAAGYAAAMGLPFAALRVISDPASRALPAIALNALKPNGDIDAWKVLRGIARKPSVIPDLMRTARDFNRAIASLRGCRNFLIGDSSADGLVTADLSEAAASAA